MNLQLYYYLTICSTFRYAINPNFQNEMRVTRGKYCRKIDAVSAEICQPSSVYGELHGIPEEGDLIGKGGVGPLSK